MVNGQLRLGLLLSGLGILLSGSSGCSLNAMTGDVMGEYGREHLIPHLLEYGDTGMVCQSGAALGGFLASFGRVTDASHSALTPSYMSAAVCAEQSARNESLRGLRANRLGRAAGVIDAEISAKRAYHLAARRLASAFMHVVEEYGPPGEACPTLNEQYDELVWLLGLVSGLQGLQHDQVSGGRVGLGMDLPVQISRAAACLDNEKWWGIPRALQAAVATAVPSEASRFEDPWRELEASAVKGRLAGVRLAGAIMIRAAHGAGRDDVRDRGITDHARSLSERASHPQYVTLDRIATEEILGISDGIWTEATGHRTPYGELGKWPKQGEADIEEEDDLLDDLE